MLDQSRPPVPNQQRLRLIAPHGSWAPRGSCAGLRTRLMPGAGAAAGTVAGTATPLTQTGAGTGAGGAAVAGSTIWGHWQLKSSREQPKSCVK